MANPNPTSEELIIEFQARAATAGAEMACHNLVEQLRARDADAAVWLDVATRMLRSAFASSATDLLAAAQVRFPRNLELRFWHANALRVGGRADAAERELRRILADAPGHRGAVLSLAHLLREQGRLQAAGEVIVSGWHARETASAELLVADLVFLRECGAHRQAHALARSAATQYPEDARISGLAGELALALGEFDDARVALREALDRDPQDGASWLRLAYCQCFDTADADDARRIADAWREPSIDEDTRTRIGFAYGKALDDLGDYAEAARVLRTANARAARRTDWSPHRWREFVDAALAAPALPRTGVAAEFCPVFVVGLPRTGTTLVSELISRHIPVRVRGELNWIDAMHTLLVQQNKLHNPVAFTGAARIIAAQMRRDDAPATWYLDKNPLNFRYLDFIAALFPRARIIHCHRDLRDTALSLWMQHFAHEDLDFSYDFSHIAGFVDGYRRLQAHWSKRPALPTCDLEYEALATDPAAAVRRVAEFLGTSLNPGEGAHPQMPSNAIATASVWQVRQPVYTRSIARWRKYAPHLPELTALFPD